MLFGILRAAPYRTEKDLWDVEALRPDLELVAIGQLHASRRSQSTSSGQDYAIRLLCYHILWSHKSATRSQVPHVTTESKSA